MDDAEILNSSDDISVDTEYQIQNCHRVVPQMKYADREKRPPHF
jgi:hypothetical protein